MGRWDEFNADDVDASGSGEVTKQTETAHLWARERATTQWGETGYEYAEGGSRLRLLTPYDYVVEVRGQTSATGHGKQGAHPSHIAELREIVDESDDSIPVLMVFVDGGRIHWMWLDNPDIPIAWIDKDPAHKRMGWFVRNMWNSDATAFMFPTASEVPVFESAGLF